MSELLGADMQAYLDSFACPANNGLRVNTLKTTVEQFSNEAGFSLQPVKWCPTGFSYDLNDDVTRSPLYHAGLYYIQEPSAMLPAEILPVKPGDRILDACSAPGGKATRLAEKLNNQGLLVSNDISFSRQKATLRNLERFGSRNHYVISQDPTDLKGRFKEYFDGILVDAPCSGEGMFRKDPSLISSWMEKDDTYYPSIQKQILCSCLEMLKPDGYLVYSTCTFSPLENEQVIEAALKVFPDVELVDLHQKYPWLEQGIGLPEAVRIYPFRQNGEGHFAALLHKIGPHITNIHETGHSESWHDPTFDQFMSDITIPLSDYVVQKIKDDVYLIPDVPFTSDHMRILRSGLLAGTVKNGRFIPSQPLAMTLSAASYSRIISLDIGDARIMKYLKGESFSVDNGTNGWNLVCLGNHPLGFASVANGYARNRIDPGWRIQ